MIRDMIMGMTRSMAFLDRGSFSIRMSLVAIASLAMLAMVTVASAHETGSLYSHLPPPWPYHAMLVTTGVVVMLGGMLTYPGLF